MRLRCRTVVTVGVAFVLLLVFAYSGQARPGRARSAQGAAAQLASAHKVRSYTVRGTLKFDVCPNTDCAGIQVFIDSATNHFGNPGQRYQMCSEDRTSTDFYPKADGELRTIQMKALDGGLPLFGCSTDPSYNVWIIEVYKGKERIMRGSVWLGQDSAGSSYKTECDRSSPYPPKDRTNWKCEKTADLSLTLSYRPPASR